MLNVLLSTYVMNLMNSYINSLEVLVEEVTFGVCVCVCVCAVTHSPAVAILYAQSTEAIQYFYYQPAKIHNAPLFGLVTSTYNLSIL